MRLHSTWKTEIQDEFSKDYFKALVKFVKAEYKKRAIYPAGSDIFAAFDKTPFDKVKVVIIGQDPYHGENQANGLAFSVRDGIDIPPSLKNIYKEIESDLGVKMPESGSLEHWAEQGVLLLNATLTVRAGEAGSHQNKGWEQFTDAAIKALSQRKKNIVYLLWGKYAQDKQNIIDLENNFILKAPHPSPLSAHRGFFGCKHFSKTNKYLVLQGEEPVYWHN